MVRQVRHGVGQRHAEVADAVKRRIGAGQNRRVRHRGDRRLRVGARVDDRLLGERVERGRQPAGGAEKPHPVRADGVEGDEEDVRFRLRMQRMLILSTGSGSSRSENKHPSKRAAHEKGRAPERTRPRSY